MKPQLAKPRQTDLLKEGYYALINLGARRKCLQVAIDEGICKLTPDATLDEAEQRLREYASKGWYPINDTGWEREGYGCFQASDGTIYYFPM